MPDFTKSDGGTLHYEVSGPRDAPTIVLIEGLSAHMLGWRAGFTDYLHRAGFKTVRFDNRDVGLSQRYPDKSYGLSDLAADTHELIEHLDVAPAHVVAQSMGGMVAQHLVLEHPHDVASLTLIYTSASSVHLNAESRGPDSQVVQSRSTSRDQAVEAHVLSEQICASRTYSFDEAWKGELGGLMWDRGFDPDGVARQANAVFNHSIDLARFDAIDVPTVIIHGTADRLIDHQASIDLHSAIPKSELWLVEGLGHDLPRELWASMTSLIVANADKAGPRNADHPNRVATHALPRDRQSA